MFINKSLKFIAYIFIFYFIYCINLNAHTLTTPRGESVEHDHRTDTGWRGQTAAWWTLWSDDFYSGMYIQRLARANKAYNCHAYAWPGSRQGQSETYCWIDTPEDNNYWEDGSYETVSQSVSTHINYGDVKDHSLLVISGNTVKSKWGKLPVYKHILYSDPYEAGPSDTQFYRKSVDVPEDYSNINSALNAAASGQTCVVSAGTYGLYENAIANSGVNIKLDYEVNLSLNGYYIKTSDGTFTNYATINPDNILVIESEQLKGYYSDINSATNNATSGQYCVAYSGTCILTGNAIVNSGITLTINTAATVNLNGNFIKLNGGSIVKNGAINPDNIQVKEASQVMGYYPTINSATNEAESGQTCEAIYGSSSLSGNAIVNSGVTLKLKSGFTVYLGGNYIKSNGGTIIRESNVGISPQDIYVKDYSLNLKGFYPLIQTAIDNISENQDIYLASSTFTENLSIVDKNGMSIYGPGIYSTRFSGNIEAENSDDCFISELYVQGDIEIVSCSYFDFYQFKTTGGFDIDYSDSWLGQVTFDKVIYGNSSILYANSVSSTYGNWYGFNIANESELDMFGGEFRNKGVAVCVNSDSYADISRTHFCDNWDFDISATGGSEAYAEDCSFTGNPQYSTIYYNETVFVEEWDLCDSEEENENQQQNVVEIPESNNDIASIDKQKGLTFQEALHFYKQITRDQNNYRKNRKIRNTDKYNIKYYDAIQKFKQLIDNNVDLSISSKALNYVTKCYRRIKQYDEAIVYLNGILNKSNHNILHPYALKEMFYFKLKKQQYDEAIMIADKIIEENTETEHISSALFAKGLIYKHYLHDNDKSAKCFEKVVLEYPNSPMALRAKRKLDTKLNKNNYSLQKETNQEIVIEQFNIGVYPNPFNLETTISYSLPDAMHVELKIFNIYGQEITTLVKGYQIGGDYRTTWNGRNNLGQVVSSGVYIYQIKTGDIINTNKMLLIK